MNGPESAAEIDESICMVPECDQPSVELHANDAALLSAKYAERWVCRWHRSNPFGDTPPSEPRA